MPDWPLAAYAEGLRSYGPAVSVRRTRVVAASLSARTAGIVRGMRVTTAEQVYPGLVVVPHDEDHHGAAFEAVLALCDEHVAGMCVAYPGLAWAALSSTEWATPEETLASDLAEALTEELGVEVFVGVATGMVAAVAAAHLGRIIPSTDTKGFLESLPLSSLFAGFDPKEREAYRDAYQFLTALGIRHLRDVWQIGQKALVTRLGNQGETLWRLATGDDIYTRAPISSTAAAVERWEFAEPAAVLEHVLLELRALSERFVDTLIARGMVAPTITISIEDTSGNVTERRWALSGPLTGVNVSSRLVWQVRAWQNHQQQTHSFESFDDGEGKRLRAVSLSSPDATTVMTTMPLWGGQAATEQVDRVVMSVQLLVGEEAVLQPHVQGGLDPRERAVLLPWKHPTNGLAKRAGDWDGQLKDAPIVMFDEPPSVRLFGQTRTGTIEPVSVTRRGLLTATPTRLTVSEGRHDLPEGTYQVSKIEGPWPLRGMWWKKPRMAGQARVFLRLHSDALSGDILAAWREGAWQVEGLYLPVPILRDLQARSSGR